MIRYDLIVKKVDGCASARVEKHELGSFVKYVDVMEHIAELEKENKELQECFDECYEELRLTRDAVEFAPRSCEPKEQKL